MGIDEVGRGAEDADGEDLFSGEYGAAVMFAAVGAVCDSGDDDGDEGVGDGVHLVVKE